MGGPSLGGAQERSTEEWEDAYRSLVLVPRGADRGRWSWRQCSRAGRIVNAVRARRSRRSRTWDSNVHRLAAIGYFKDARARSRRRDHAEHGRDREDRTDRLAQLSGSLDAAEELAREQVPAGRPGTPEEYGDWSLSCARSAPVVTGTTSRSTAGSCARSESVGQTAVGEERGVRGGGGVLLERLDLIERHPVDTRVRPSGLRRGRGRRSPAPESTCGEANTTAQRRCADGAPRPRPGNQVPRDRRARAGCAVAVRAS